MAQSRSMVEDEILALCKRVFPGRDEQQLLEILPLQSRQHEMTSFVLSWVENGARQTERMVVRRYVSLLSWWRTNDRGKAQREATICRWLHDVGLPVPEVYAREFGPDGDLVLFSWIEGHEIEINERSLKDAVSPYITKFAEELARLHTTFPPRSVQQVVPKVSISGALANLSALAYQVGEPELLWAVEKVLLQAHQVQELSPVLVHGDFHLLNALIRDEEIVGIIDWEFAALGDPRWDVANTYMQLVDFGAAAAADEFLAAYFEFSNKRFIGPPLFNVVVPLQQWALSEWLLQKDAQGELPHFALAYDLVEQREIHRHRAETAMELLA